MIGDAQSIVIDAGSETIKAGFAGDTGPRCSLSQESLVVINHPIERGCVTSWEDMETLLQHIFANELKVDQSRHSVLFIENPLVDGNKEPITQMMFEKFDVHSFYIGISSLMSLYSTGHLNGVVVESGHDQTSIVPVWAGYPVKGMMMKTNVAGRAVTSFLQELEGDYCEMSEYKALKEREADLGLDHTSNYFKCGELLFNPSMNGFELEGIDKLLFESINGCESKMHSRLYSQISLSGGTTMLKGFHERIRSEITRLAPENMKVGVVAPEDRQLSPWVGGSILASIDQFHSISITSHDYKENGSRIALQKCI